MTRGDELPLHLIGQNQGKLYACLQARVAEWTAHFGRDLCSHDHPSGSLVQLNAAVYGLVNAPSAWRKTIVRGIENLGLPKIVLRPLHLLLDG